MPGLAPRDAKVELPDQTDTISAYLVDQPFAVRIQPSKLHLRQVNDGARIARPAPDGLRQFIHLGIPLISPVCGIRPDHEKINIASNPAVSPRNRSEEPCPTRRVLPPTEAILQLRNQLTSHTGQRRDAAGRKVLLVEGVELRRRVILDEDDAMLR